MKAPEPLNALPETAVVQEMRLMHVDFVEEAYWKRLAGFVLAKECKKKILSNKMKQHKVNAQTIEQVKVQPQN